MSICIWYYGNGGFYCSNIGITLDYIRDWLYPSLESAASSEHSGNICTAMRISRRLISIFTRRTLCYVFFTQALPMITSLSSLLIIFMCNVQGIPKFKRKLFINQQMNFKCSCHGFVTLFLFKPYLR